MIDVVIMTSGENLWKLRMNQVPGLDEKIIIGGKLYKVANLTWIIENTETMHVLCNIFILEI